MFRTHKHFIQNKCNCAVQVSISSLINLETVDNYLDRKSDQDKSSIKCVRCGAIMKERKSIFITIHPPMKNPAFNLSTTCLGRVSEASHNCGLVDSFHVSTVSDTDYNKTNFKNLSENYFNNPIQFPDYEENEKLSGLKNSQVQCFCSCKRNSCQCQKPDFQKLDSNALRRQSFSDTCTDCHIALVFNYCQIDSNAEILLMLQVSDISSSIKSDECPTEFSNSMVEAEAKVNTLNLYPNELPYSSSNNSTDDLLGSKEYSNQLPDFNEENEAAYKSHLRDLVPCSYCGRRFYPDRVMFHQGVCIERPRNRKK